MRALENRRPPTPFPTFAPDPESEELEWFEGYDASEYVMPSTCRRLADETVNEGINEAYTEEMGRTASDEEEAHWRARYREHEAEHCDNAASPKTYVRAGITESDEAAAYRFAKYARLFEESVRQPERTPQPTLRPRYGTPCPTPRYSWETADC